MGYISIQHGLYRVRSKTVNFQKGYKDLALALKFLWEYEKFEESRILLTFEQRKSLESSIAKGFNKTQLRRVLKRCYQVIDNEVDNFENIYDYSAEVAQRIAFNKKHKHWIQQSGLSLDEIIKMDVVVPFKKEQTIDATKKTKQSYIDMLIEINNKLNIILQKLDEKHD